MSLRGREVRRFGLALGWEVVTKDPYKRSFNRFVGRMEMNSVPVRLELGVPLTSERLSAKLDIPKAHQASSGASPSAFPAYVDPDSCRDAI